MHSIHIALVSLMIGCGQGKILPQGEGVFENMRLFLNVTLVFHAVDGKR